VQGGAGEQKGRSLDSELVQHIGGEVGAHNRSQAGNSELESRRRASLHLKVCVDRQRGGGYRQSSAESVQDREAQYVDGKGVCKNHPEEAQKGEDGSNQGHHSVCVASEKGAVQQTFGLKI